MEFVGEPKFMQRSIPAAMKAVQGPPSWSKMAGDANVDARFRNNSTRHFEQRHFNKWQLDMKKEADLGLMPAEWSVSSAMNDPRPNGRAMFDARFVESPVGRARGGHAMVWDAKGTAHAGGTQKAKNISVEDIADAMEEKGAGLMHHGYSAYMHESAASFNDDGVGRIDGEDPDLAASWGGGAEGQFVQVDQDRDGVIDKAGSASVWSKAEMASGRIV